MPQPEIEVDVTLIIPAQGDQIFGLRLDAVMGLFQMRHYDQQRRHDHEVAEYEQQLVGIYLPSREIVPVAPAQPRLPNTSSTLTPTRSATLRISAIFSSISQFGSPAASS